MTRSACLRNVRHVNVSLTHESIAQIDILYGLDREILSFRICEVTVHNPDLEWNPQVKSW